MTDRKVLLLVTGMTPQIVTETVYGLAFPEDGSEPWIADEIHVISTQDGLNQIRDRLFEKGNFLRLIEDYKLPSIKFNENTLHCIKNTKDEHLNDLKTLADNELAADKICDLIRKFTADPNTTLHVSIAGGRKTMGFYAGYALSLYGRAQDRMSHVLVDDRFEAVSNFYYPTLETRFVTNRDGKTLDAKEAKVWLANISFVRLRDFLAPHNLVSQAKFSDVISSIRLAQQPLSIKINPKKRTISIENTECKLPPRGFAFYYWFALRAINNDSPYKRPVESEYREIPDLWEMWKGKGAIDPLNKKSGLLTIENFEQGLSDIKKNLTKIFGHTLLPKININNGLDGDFLPLQPNQIEIVTE